MKTYTRTIEETKPKLVIEYDDNATSPREDTCLGYFISIDRNYNSPDNNEELISIVRATGNEANNQAEHMELIKNHVIEDMGEKVIAIYPIVKYEHGGVSYSLGTVHNFDYSNNGFYIITDKTKKIIGTDEKDFLKVIKSELDLYNKYANGEVYQFCLYDDKGEIEDSCSGYYDIEDIRESLPEEWKDEKLSDYLIH